MPFRLRRDSESSSDSWSLVEDDNAQDSNEFSIDSSDELENDDDEPIVEEPETENELELQEEAREISVEIVTEESDIEEQTIDETLSEDETQQSELSDEEENFLKIEELVPTKPKTNETSQSEKVRPLFLLVVVLSSLTIYQSLTYVIIKQFKYSDMSSMDYLPGQQSWAPEEWPKESNLAELVRDQKSDVAKTMFIRYGDRGESKKISKIQTLDKTVRDNGSPRLYSNSTSNWEDLMDNVIKVLKSKNDDGPVPPLNICTPRITKNNHLFRNNYKYVSRSFPIYAVKKNNRTTRSAKLSPKSKTRAVQPFYNPTSKRRVAKIWKPKIQPCLEFNSSFAPCEIREKKNLPMTIPRKMSKRRINYVQKAKSSQIKGFVSKDASKAMRNLKNTVQRQCDLKEMSKYSPRRKPIMFKAPLPCVQSTVQSKKPTEVRQKKAALKKEFKPKLDWFTIRGQKRESLRRKWD